MKYHEDIQKTIFFTKKLIYQSMVRHKNSVLLHFHTHNVITANLYLPPFNMMSHTHTHKQNKQIKKNNNAFKH